MNTASNNNIARAIYLASKNNISSGKIVEFLARKRLFGKVPAILAQLGKIVNTENGTVLVKVKSAKKLEAEEKRELEQFLTKHYFAKEVILEESVDQKLLGGSRIEINDEVIDLTLANKILKLQAHLINPI